MSTSTVEIHDIRKAQADAPLGESGLKALREERAARKEAQRVLRKLERRVAAIEARKAPDMAAMLSGLSSIHTVMEAELARHRQEIAHLGTA